MFGKAKDVLITNGPAIRDFKKEKLDLYNVLAHTNKKLSEKYSIEEKDIASLNNVETKLKEKVKTEAKSLLEPLDTADAFGRSKLSYLQRAAKSLDRWSNAGGYTALVGVVTMIGGFVYAAAGSVNGFIGVGAGLIMGIGALIECSVVDTAAKKYHEIVGIVDNIRKLVTGVEPKKEQL